MNQIDPVGPNVSFLFMPIDGVAAYWLSLHKLLGASRNTRALEAEAHFVGEPFIRHLLDMLMSPVSAARCRIFAEICGKSEINRLDRQFDLMRITIMDMATGENPLRTLARFTARFPGYIADPEGMLEQGQAQLNEALNGTLPADAYRIDHTLSDEVLIARLLFYATLCRRHGKSSCRGFLPQEGSVFFTDALALVLDGFDAPFIRKWMKRFKSTALEDVQRKIALSIDLCLAIQERVTFEETRFLVRSYIR